MLGLDALLGIGGKLIDKLIPDPEQKAKAQLELAKMAQDGELAKMANDTEMFKAEQENTTARWTADMASDSWLSKNIRPIALIAIFIAYFMFTAMSAFGYNARELRKPARFVGPDSVPRIFSGAELLRRSWK
jgi:hypothetical protein